MQINRRQLLIDLGPDALADALLDLASRHEAVENRVSRMTSSGAENLGRFQRGLKDIIREDHFYTWRDSHLLVDTLTGLLADLDAADVDPWQGVEAVFELYRSDEEIIMRCEDSTGDVSMIFTHDAPEVFSRFLSQCDDDVRLIDALIDLTRQDPFDLRASLFDSAADHLSEQGVETLVDRLWALARHQDTPYERSYWLSAIEAVARRTGNAPLFEEARRAAPGELSASDVLEIAKIYHATGDSLRGLEILNARPMDALDTRRDHLLVDIHRALGNREQMARVAKRIFDDFRSEKTLAILIESMGEDKRESIIEKAVETILRGSSFSSIDVDFLISTERIAEAARYVIDRADQIRGVWYGTWVPVADTFRQHGQWLAATLAYRALLDSILERGASKAYHHGVRYLQSLEAIAGEIQDWHGFARHQSYVESLRRTHGRKWSFWKRYEE